MSSQLEEAVECRFCDAPGFVGPTRWRDYHNHVRVDHAEQPDVDPLPSPPEAEGDPVPADPKEEQPDASCPECDKPFYDPRATTKVAVHRATKHGVKGKAAQQRADVRQPKTDRAGRAAPNVPAPDLRKVTARLADRAEKLLEVVEEYQATGVTDVAELDKARWRLGAALADWWEAIDGTD